MKAIVTKYHGPTNARGSRITARAEGVPAVTVSYDHALDSEENHRAAAEALIARMGWGDRSKLCGGGMPSGDGYAFVFSDGCAALKRPARAARR